MNANKTLSSPKNDRHVRIAIGVFWLVALAASFWWARTGPRPTAAEQAALQERAATEQAAWQARQQTAQQARQEADELRLSLCRMAAACKKYSEARLECAIAGNLRTCLR